MSITIERGSTAVIQSTISPASLVTGSTIYFMAKRATRDADVDAVISKVSDDGIAVTDESGGVIQISINPDDTRSLPNVDVTLYYEIEIEKAGAIYNPETGELIVTHETVQRVLA